MSDFYSLEPAAQAIRLEAAGHAALERWDVTGARLDLIKHRENAVFRVTGDGLEAALRLHRHGYHTDEELWSELQWMQALAAAGVMVPQVIPAAGGELFVTHVSEDLPGELQVDLFEWIDGEQLGSVEQGINNPLQVDATYRAIGEMAARVHNQAVSWRLPPRFTRHAWDADGLAGEQPLWGQFWKLAAASKAEAELLARGRARVYGELKGLPKSPGTYSMIHADFAPENVMVGKDGVRLIDFDDAGFGWHLFELATSLFFIQGENYFDRAQAALIAGYREHRQLTDESLEMLPLHLLARGFTYLGWVHTRPETQTAKEMTPALLQMACELTEDYLSG